MIAEFANVVTSSALMASLFFGGWDIPFTGWDNAAPFTVLKTVATLASFLIKTGFFIFVFMWIRWTLPRFRYDQLMSLGWKFMLPLALGYIVLIAAIELVLQSIGIGIGPVHSFILLMANLCVVLLVFVFFDEGRLISPAYGRLQQRELLRMRAISRERSLESGVSK
jgi:NADH-quinone oxidoreductase subunit H